MHIVNHKMRGLAREAEGRPIEARREYLTAAMLELKALRKLKDGDAAFRAGVAEVVACLANASAVHRRRPLLKEHVRTVVKKFLDRCFPQD